VESLAEDYQLVIRWHQRILDIGRILEPTPHKTSQSVEQQLSRYLHETEAILTQTFDQPFVDNLKRYSQGFWKGLFTCYDHSLIRRTNNDLELFIKGIKRKHRRITGLRNWSRYIQQHGELIVFAENAFKDPNLMARLQAVSYQDYRKKWECWHNRIQEHRKHLRFKKNPQQYLQQLENRWLSD
jgi:hypothetical protein